jgi:PPOX class probable F420-dependent enzyme
MGDTAVAAQRKGSALNSAETVTDIAKEMTLQATTWRRDGTPVMTTIWPVPWSDGKLAFVTPKQSGKVKRLKHTPRIKLQASDWDGFPIDGSAPVEGDVELVTGEGYEQVFALILDKYGRDAWDSAVGRAQEYFESQGIKYIGDLAVVVTPDG